MRVAIIDIGSNSTRLLIADVEDDRVENELDRRSEVTRLGAGVDVNGRLREDAMERVYAVLNEYEEATEDNDVEKKIAVLTSAVRDAKNGEEFAHTVQEHYGFEPHVLSGDDEAGLTFLGATSGRDPEDHARTLVVDIGGGSTELVVGSGREASFHVSTQAGVVRQTERYIDSDPPSADELDELATDVREIISGAVNAEARRAVQHGIGVAGTATSLAAIAQRLDPYDPEKVHGYLLSRAEAERILGELAAIPLAQRRRVPGLHPDRAPTIIAGVIILREVMELFGLSEIEISEHDILRGAALALA
ncbi:MAG: Ppx/GppA family phosphatase [Solirubrobacterales bacterium]|nr:Ppx/GppA family phosphatase [Solirubrobacterales bacterium]MBV9167023.1 Ppx/GppA family phosphatase [Solirubrobacterales bacterium]